jgi:hypothetical protein
VAELVDGIVTEAAATLAGLAARAAGAAGGPPA